MKKGKGPIKELRIVISPDAQKRIIAQATLLDQSVASFCRQIIMEKVTALEAAGSQGDSIMLFRKMLEIGEKQESSEKR